MCVVDDVSQRVVDTLGLVVHFLVCVALAFVAAARAFKLCITDPVTGNTKSILVASHPKMVPEVTFAFKAVGITSMYASFARDIVLLLSVHKARRFSIIAQSVARGWSSIAPGAGLCEQVPA